MDVFFPKYLLDLLIISTTISIVQMALIQKFKKLPFIRKVWQVWILNLFFSFALGIPFALWFYELNIIDSIWVSIFCFIGAPSLYDVFKNQNLVNYKPISLDDNMSVPIENEIKRN